MRRPSRSPKRPRRRRSSTSRGWQSTASCDKLRAILWGRCARRVYPKMLEGRGPGDGDRGVLSSVVERRPYKANVGSSTLSAPTITGTAASNDEGESGTGSNALVMVRRFAWFLGVVVQLVRIPACHAGGRGFESRPLRQVAGKRANRVRPFSRGTAEAPVKAQTAR
jgi:hypothetical protein